MTVPMGKRNLDYILITLNIRIEHESIDVRRLGQPIQEPFHPEVAKAFVETAVRLLGLLQQPIVDGRRHVLERSFGHRRDSR